MSSHPSDLLHPVRVLAACLLSTVSFRSEAIEIVAGPGEAGLRAAIAQAQDDDTVIVTGNIDLQAPVRIDKRLTIRSDRGPNSGFIGGQFAGELFQVAADGVALEWLRLWGRAPGSVGD